MIGDRAQLLVESIDAALLKIAEALNRGQPPYTGKLGISFVDEGAERLTPVVQRLRITKAGKCLPLRVPILRLSSRAARKSSFAINHAEVKALLKETEYLIKTRKEINQRLRDIKHWERMFCAANEGKVKASPNLASELHARIEDNVRGLKTRASKVAERQEKGVEVVFMGNKSTEQRKSRATY